MIDNRYLRNQHVSPLLRLPAEIRNKIYTLVLSGHSINLSTFNPNHPTYTLFRKQHTRQKALLALLTALPSTCRQIRAETKPLPFSLNDFILVQGLQKRLNETQFHAVRTLKWSMNCLHTDILYDNYDKFTMISPGVVEHVLGMLAKMRSLQHLIVCWSEMIEDEEVWERLRKGLVRELRSELGMLGRRDIKVSVVLPGKGERSM